MYNQPSLAILLWFALSLSGFSLSAQNKLIQPDYENLSRSEWRALLKQDPDPWVSYLAETSDKMRRQALFLVKAGLIGLGSNIALSLAFGENSSYSENFALPLGLLSVGSLLSSGILALRAQYLLGQSKKEYLKLLAWSPRFDLDRQGHLLIGFKLDL